MPNPPNLKKALLEPLETVLIPAIPEPFVVRDRFQAAGIRFSSIWTPFRKRFFDLSEEPAVEFALQKHRLLNIAPDELIITTLGGEPMVAGTVAAVFELMRRQANGQEGILQTNGYANIFYVRDKTDELCAIRVGWDGEGWVIDAISVQDPLAWNGQHVIFCPVY